MSCAVLCCLSVLWRAVWQAKKLHRLEQRKRLVRANFWEPRGTTAAVANTQVGHGCNGSSSSMLRAIGAGFNYAHPLCRRGLVVVVKQAAASSSAMMPMTATTRLAVADPPSLANTSALPLATTTRSTTQRMAVSTAGGGASSTLRMASTAMARPEPIVAGPTVVPADGPLRALLRLPQDMPGE